MFQRLKGAIDSRIAEEQARQKAALQSPSRSNSGAKRPTSRAVSPAIRSSRTRLSESKGGDTKGPDPREFDPEFVIDDEETPARGGTPGSSQAKNEEGSMGNSAGEKSEADSGMQTSEKTALDDSAAQTPELPTDVRVKLRKLERLEPRYQELLRSYRIAHARVSTIEPFETTLRENTPLTSINDPAALVEYLNQLNLKSDMVLDELKRVSSERASFKQKLEEAEKKTKEALEGVEKLQEHRFTNGDSTPHTNGAASTDTTPQESLHEHGSSTPTASDASDAKAEQGPKSPSTSTKLRTPSIVGISLFSPKVKPADSPRATEASEEFFSYESELPRLEVELEKRNGEVTSLQREVITLKGDLSVARESTQSMVQTMENATLELNQLRERKERYEVEIANERQSSDTLISSLRAELQHAESRVRQSEEDERLLQEARSELEKLKDCDLARADAVVNVGKLHAEIDSLRKDISNMQSDRDNGVRRVSTLEGLVNNLRNQLSQAEDAERTLKSEIENGSTKIRSLQLRITEMEKDAELVSQNVPAHQSNVTVVELDSNANAEMGGETKSAVSGITSKKKNKKKKKNGKVETQQDADPSSIALEPATAGPRNISLSAIPNESVAKLQGELINLRVLLEEKDAAIEKLHSKIKNGEDMQEEIDSLRDDLLNIGQEHVETKDKVKELLAEKSALVDNVKELEKEISDLRVAHASSIYSSEEAHKELAAQFDDLKTRAANLQTDLTVAQQLASSRFKELTELRTVLQKAQPELTNLRSENGELRVIKDELTKKIIDLQRIEAQQDSAQTRITELKQTVAEKDTELKGLISRLNEEVLTRQTTEDANSKASQEVQRLEDEKRAASQALDRISQELAQSRKELRTAKSKALEMEDSITRLTRDSDGLKEDIELKIAQYASAESLMSSMRDQTSEMALQTKEARERCEGLEEEVAEAHRLLAERSREGETMRRLLAEVEGRTDSRIREMKERMEVAIEERDRAEDEASTVGRRRARELEEVRNKLKDVERTLKRTEEDKEELDKAQRDWKKRREELEQKLEDSVREAEEVRKAMVELRDALDESERQARDLEKQKSELRKSVGETQHRLEKLQKANKSMADEVRSIQAAKNRALDSQAQSPRSSFDSSQTRAKIGSPPLTARTNSAAMNERLPNGQATPSIDYVYLKNVLLQFLEQKDKKHQMQLIPVLGMLLHFDGKDEQKWTAAVTAR